MITKEDLQSAIDAAAKGSLGAVVKHEAFEYSLAQGWIPRPKCLIAGYSSGEAVLCAILLQFYFEMHGRPEHVVIPDGRDYSNSPTDLIWPGAWYFTAAVGRLSNESAWSSIKSLLPGE